VIPPEIVAQLEKLRRYAETHHVSLMRILKTVKDGATPLSENQHYRVDIPGVRVCFTVEQQKGGIFRHVSFTAHPPREGVKPDADMIAEVLPLLGFKTIGVLKWTEARDGSVNRVEPYV
jgi:hypothetical protein